VAACQNLTIEQARRRACPEWPPFSPAWPDAFFELAITLERASGGRGVFVRPSAPQKRASPRNFSGNSAAQWMAGTLAKRLRDL